MSKKTKKGPHPHDKKEQQQIAGCPRCRGKEIVTPAAPIRVVKLEDFEAEMDAAILGTSLRSPVVLHVIPLPDTSGLAPLEVLPLSSVPLEAEPDKAPDAPVIHDEDDGDHGRIFTDATGKPHYEP
jgi:hypothetical protein